MGRDTFLNCIFRAGFVRRWHTNPDLAHTCDRIDGHSARVARIILALHPNPSPGLIKGALIHDDGESVVGDMPFDAKTGHLATEHSRAERKAKTEIWGTQPILKSKDVQWLKFADRLDAYMWARHHAPHVMGRDGWPEARDWLIDEARKLGTCLDL